MQNVIAAIAPIAMLIALGALLRSRLLPSGEFWRGINALAYDVLFPALLVDDLARTTFASGALVGDLGIVVGATVLVGALTFALRPSLRIDGRTFTSVFQGATRFNSYVYLAVAQGLFGATGTATAAVFIALMLIVTNVASVAVLDAFGGAGDRLDPLRTLGATLRNPVVVSAAVGVAASLAHVPVHPVLHVFLRDLGGASLPLSLLAVGAGIRPVRDRGQIRAASAACALKFVALPFLVLAGLRLAGASGMPARIALLYAALPCAGNAYTLALLMGGDEEMMAAIITVSTLASIATITVIMGTFAR